MRLILMRHAKSDWGLSGLRDHDRPLNERGRLAAPLMGAWLREHGYTPAQAIVSSAKRTQETWARLGVDAPMDTRPELYNSDAEAILWEIRATPGAGPLISISHQPGVQEAANRFLKDGFVSSFPTAKLVVMDFDAESWADVRFGAAKLVAEAAPKEIV